MQVISSVFAIEIRLKRIRWGLAALFSLLLTFASVTWPAHELEHLFDDQDAHTCSICHISVQVDHAAPAQEADLGLMHTNRASYRLQEEQFLLDVSLIRHSRDPPAFLKPSI